MVPQALVAGLSRMSDDSEQCHQASKGCEDNLDGYKKVNRELGLELGGCTRVRDDAKDMLDRQPRQRDQAIDDKERCLASTRH